MLWHTQAWILNFYQKCATFLSKIKPKCNSSSNYPFIKKYVIVKRELYLVKNCMQQRMLQLLHSIPILKRRVNANIMPLQKHCVSFETTNKHTHTNIVSTALLYNNLVIVLKSVYNYLVCSGTCIFESHCLKRHILLLICHLHPINKCMHNIY